LVSDGLVDVHLLHARFLEVSLMKEPRTPRYECDKCGACCNRIIVEVTELDLIREPRLMEGADRIKLGEGMILVDDYTGEPCEEAIPGWGAGALLACGIRKPCPQLGADNLCQVYPTRPNCCVAFRAGSDLCQEARGMAGLPKLEPIGCPS
jgi:Fe-S-cluster containining protein